MTSRLRRDGGPQTRESWSRFSEFARCASSVIYTWPLLLAGLSLAGCHSRFIQATIENDTTAPLRIVELDYPGASFGVSTLAPHASYSYRFKLLGSGPLLLTYLEATGASRSVNGPEVREGQQGSLVVHIGEHGAVQWQPHLTAP